MGNVCWNRGMERNDVKGLEPPLLGKADLNPSVVWHETGITATFSIMALTWGACQSDRSLHQGPEISLKTLFTNHSGEQCCGAQVRMQEYYVPHGLLYSNFILGSASRKGTDHKQTQLGVWYKAPANQGFVVFLCVSYAYTRNSQSSFWNNQMVIPNDFLQHKGCSEVWRIRFRITSTLHISNFLNCTSTHLCC